MKLFQRITLALMGCMLLSTPAMAADYSFETKAPADYYGSTAYEEVYGAQYNYGGQNAVDFLDPLADSAPSPLAGNTIEYGIGSSSGSIYPDGTSNDYPLQWGGPSVTPVTAFRVTIAELAFCAGISSQLLSLIELDSGRQSPQHEAMLRRACAALMSARHAELAQMEAELSACPNIFAMEQGDQDGV